MSSYNLDNQILNNNSRFSISHFIPLTFFSVSLLSIAFNSDALNSMTATSKGLITGNSPYLLVSDNGQSSPLMNLSQVMGIQVWDGTYNADNSKRLIEISANEADKQIDTAVGITFGDIITSVPIDGQPHNLVGLAVGDDDGDADSIENQQVLGSITATWYQGDTPIYDLSQKLMSCQKPYQLKIEMKDVIAQTTYGLPNKQNYGENVITYNVKGYDKGICNIRPLSMHVFNEIGFHLSYPNGYNENQWDKGTNYLNNEEERIQVGGGFKPNAGFPTSGFKGAEFSLVGYGEDQSQYLCSTDSQEITLVTKEAGKNCTVIFKEKPVNDIVIKMFYKKNNDWVLNDSYTIKANKITRWAVVLDEDQPFGDAPEVSNSVHFPTLDACVRKIDGNRDYVSTWYQGAGQDDADRRFRQKYLYRRDEFTNSPYADRTRYPENTSPTYIHNFASRAVDGTFMGEWGRVDFYPESNWSRVKYDSYWTAEAYSPEYQFLIYKSGNVNLHDHTFGNSSVVCRGE